MIEDAYGISSCCRDSIHAHVNEVRLDHLPPAPDGSVRLPCELFWIDRHPWRAGRVCCAAFDRHLPYPQGWQACYRKQAASLTGG